MTPTELAAAIQKTEDIVLAACPVIDPNTGLAVDMRDHFGYLMHDLKLVLTQYGATPEAIAQYLIETIQSVPPFATLPGYWSGWKEINSEGFTTLVLHFIPPGVIQAGLTPAQIYANAIATANVQRARDGKDFLDLNGGSQSPQFNNISKQYDQFTADYIAAQSALIAAATSTIQPGEWNGVERRVSGVTDRRGAVQGGSISPGRGIS